jgi:excisionase family DNA binding protein
LAAFLAFLAACAASLLGRFFSFGAGCLATAPPYAPGGAFAVNGQEFYRAGVWNQWPSVNRLANFDGMYTPEKTKVDVMAREKQMFEFLTVSEVALLMRVSNMTVYRLIKSGALKAVQVGNRYRVKEADVHQYLDDHYVRAV